MVHVQAMVFNTDSNFCIPMVRNVFFFFTKIGHFDLVCKILNKNVVNEVNFLVHLKLRGRRPDEMTYALSKDLHFAHLDVLF